MLYIRVAGRKDGCTGNKGCHVPAGGPDWAIKWRRSRASDSKPIRFDVTPMVWLSPNDWCVSEWGCFTHKHRGLLLCGVCMFSAGCSPGTLQVLSRTQSTCFLPVPKIINIQLTGDSDWRVFTTACGLLLATYWVPRYEFYQQCEEVLTVSLDCWGLTLRVRRIDTRFQHICLLHDACWNILLWPQWPDKERPAVQGTRNGLSQHADFRFCDMNVLQEDCSWPKVLHSDLSD